MRKPGANAAGRLTTKRLTDGAAHRLTWDERDRLLAIDAGDIRIDYAYDEAGRMTRAATMRAGAAAPETEIILAYDEAGRVVGEHQNGVPIRYSYDPAGRYTGRASPTGEAKRAFDGRSLLANFESNGHALAFVRDAVGQEIARYATGPAGGFALTQQYDVCGRLTRQRAGRQALPGAPSPAADITRRYDWDRADRLVGVADSLRGDTAYQYDPRDQVRAVTRPPMGRSRLTDEAFAYDALMNITASPAGAHEYRADCVIRAGGNTYIHDARGRMISKTVARAGFRPKTWSFGWDNFDRLTNLRTPEGADWRYTYDAFNRRIAKRCLTPGRGRSVSYLWEGARIAEAWRQGEAAERWHYTGGFLPLAKEVVPIEDGDWAPAEARFYPMVTDHLGTPKEVFSPTGIPLWQSEHSLWGRSVTELSHRRPTIAADGTASPDTGLSAEAYSPLRFQNQWEDEESGLHHNLNRYYEPDSGQYLSQDPIGIAGGMRTQAYLRPRPARRNGPVGLVILRTCQKHNGGWVCPPA